MNPRNIAVLVVAVILAGGAAFMVRSYLNQATIDAQKQVEQKIQTAPPQIPTEKVLVAKTDLVVGTFVRAEDLHWQTWPTESIAPNYVVQNANFADAGKGEKRLTIDDFKGAVVRLPITAGQPMTPGLVARAGEQGFLAAVLRPGMRAISVAINATSGISGFMLPGDRVDLIWNVKTKVDYGGGFTGFTQTIMKNIRVIAIDQRTQANSATPARTATLEVTPKQAEAINLANSLGKLDFTLRSVAPEEDGKELEDDELSDGLLLASGPDGLAAGGLLDSELLTVSLDEEEQPDILKDSYTLPAELLFNLRAKPRQQVQQPRRASSRGSGSGGGGGGATVRRTSTGSSTTKVSIVRGTQTQTVTVKK